MKQLWAPCLTARFSLMVEIVRSAGKARGETPRPQYLTVLASARMMAL